MTRHFKNGRMVREAIRRITEANKLLSQPDLDGTKTAECIAVLEDYAYPVACELKRQRRINKILQAQLALTMRAAMRMLRGVSIPATALFRAPEQTQKPAGIEPPIPLSPDDSSEPSALVDWTGGGHYGRIPGVNAVVQLFPTLSGTCIWRLYETKMMELRRDGVVSEGHATNKADAQRASTDALMAFAAANGDPRFQAREEVGVDTGKPATSTVDAKNYPDSPTVTWDGNTGSIKGLDVKAFADGKRWMLGGPDPTRQVAFGNADSPEAAKTAATNALIAYAKDWIARGRPQTHLAPMCCTKVKPDRMLAYESARHSFVIARCGSGRHVLMTSRAVPMGEWVLSLPYHHNHCLWNELDVSDCSLCKKDQVCR